ncbi:hypothetical protein FBEOM_13075 [Fusarium beomiforme]|uniref:AMP-dependent synthetase/ligase domain-containing protein n=1 Tax=Fusarium beomiforme TaxID=44412 RepID=A0A9P5A804_9HYPO|nr:hypothetical protein FBEOM_13075 [Fusarium beomiforme]
MSDPIPATALDPNVWYHITEQAVDQNYKNDFKAMLQTNQDPKSNDTNLHVWPVKTDDKPVEAYWQFQPVSSTPGRYMLRYSQTGIHKQLAVCLLEDVDDADTRTRPCLLKASSDETQQWDVAEWKSNSTYRFINVHNGTKFHLDCIPNGPVFMSSDVDDRPYQSRQHWLMTSASSVDDQAYSTTISEGPSSTKISGENSSSSDNDLSSGAIAGISVGVVLGAIMIAVSLAAYFLWRSRKMKNGINTSPGDTMKSRKEKSGNSSPAPPYQHFSPEDVGRSQECSELDGNPGGAKVPPTRTPLSALRTTAAAQPYATAIKQAHAGLNYSDISYYQFEKDVELTASYWRTTFSLLGITEKSVIGVWLKGTSYEDLLHIWGISRAGYIPQLISLRMTDPTVAHELLTAAGAAALVHDPFLTSALHHSTLTTFPAGGLLSRLGSKNLPLDPLEKISDGDQVLMLYHTSGSTSGLPKLVPITARWIDCLIQKFSIISKFIPSMKPMVKVAIGSSTHMGSTMLFLESILQGGCFIFPTSLPYPTSELIDMIENQGLTRLDMFPVFLSQLFRQARQDPLLFKSLCRLDHIAYGGLPLDSSEEAWARGHNFYLINSFGSTEVGINLISYGSETALSPVSPSKFEFIPIDKSPNAQEHLVELVVPPESPDCPHPSLRDARDGKFHTGDLFLEIAPSKYVFKGRDDDWIKMEMALRCDANSIETDALNSCGDDLIKSVVAIGAGRPSPAIVVETKDPGVLESADKVLEFKRQILQRITPFHRRRYQHERIEDINLIFVVPPGSLPRTDTKGNIRRRKVEEQFKQKMDEVFR